MDGCSDEIKIGKGFKKEFIRGFCENDWMYFPAVWNVGYAISVT